MEYVTYLAEKPDSACIVWGQTCGQQGNCWLYDGHRLGFLLNFTASGIVRQVTVRDVCDAPFPQYNCTYLPPVQCAYISQTRRRSFPLEPGANCTDLADLLSSPGLAFLLGGTLLDVGVWYHVGDLQIYDEENEMLPTGENIASKEYKTEKVEIVDAE